MPLHFLVDGIGEPPVWERGGAVVLTGAEAYHAAVVRRVRVGERVTVGDGVGTWGGGEVESVTPKEVVIRVADVAVLPAPSPRVVLVQALAKGDRDELAVQAATELGADEIVPWQAARSVSRWDAAKSAKGVARWSAIVREAAKQAHRAWLPAVTAPAGLGDLVARAGQARTLVLEPTASARLSDVNLDVDDPRDVVLVVGPEGGMAPAELSALQDAGATLVRLGDTVLRTSTAGPAALALVNVRLGRW
ncbi:16S rRNA (uracil(1498)-N(3))-methyltransferase [Microbacterium sp.]|uniref:16S rRNA (uracil(1498)-N(3))-methyltransferase n=1 Tax=Microbacterium sp. TaxID=51671 RepID=UPI0039E4433D